MEGEEAFEHAKQLEDERDELAAKNAELSDLANDANVLRTMKEENDRLKSENDRLLAGDMRSVQEENDKLKKDKDVLATRFHILEKELKTLKRRQEKQQSQVVFEGACRRICEPFLTLFLSPHVSDSQEASSSSSSRSSARQSSKTPVAPAAVDKENSAIHMHVSKSPSAAAESELQEKLRRNMARVRGTTSVDK